MLVATWNVNSLRARLERLLAWLAERRPDVVLLQETKCTDEQFPREEIEEAGYSCATFGQKSYNGVAILARRPVEDVARGLGDERFDGEARVIAAQVDDLLVVNVYAINGREVGHPRYDEKLAWFARLTEFVSRRFDLSEKLVVAGDFNVTFDDLDVWDPSRWRGRILCSEPEREALRRFVDVGLVDAVRRFHEEGGVYTWWDYRSRAFERGDRGLRIDHILLSEPAFEGCEGVEVDRAMRSGKKPSDHAPVLARLR